MLGTSGDEMEINLNILLPIRNKIYKFYVHIKFTFYGSQINDFINYLSSYIYSSISVDIMSIQLLGIHIIQHKLKPTQNYIYTNLFMKKNIAIIIIK